MSCQSSNSAQSFWASNSSCSLLAWPSHPSTACGKFLEFHTVHPFWTGNIYEYEHEAIKTTKQTKGTLNTKDLPIFRKMRFPIEILSAEPPQRPVLHRVPLGSELQRPLDLLGKCWENCWFFCVTRQWEIHGNTVFVQPFLEETHMQMMLHDFAHGRLSIARIDQSKLDGIRHKESACSLAGRKGLKVDAGKFPRKWAALHWDLPTLPQELDELLGRIYGVHSPISPATAKPEATMPTFQG